MKTKTKAKKHTVLFCVLGGAAILFFLLCAGAWSMFGEEIRSANTIRELEPQLYYMEYSGDDGLDGLLAQGGADSDSAVAQYVIGFLSKGFYTPDTQAVSGRYGCSTLAVQNTAGEQLFARNYDWTDCTAMIVETHPKNGYASIATCDLEFLGFGEDFIPDAGIQSKMMALAAIYVPLDGMNEKGLCVADLAVPEQASAGQATALPDLTTTTAIRLLLDRAANVDEAVALLRQYDMHPSAGMGHHFSISDAQGNAVVVEYYDGALHVTETSIVTNHYLTQGELQGTGSEQSHTRWDRLSAAYTEHNGVLEADALKQAICSVRQGMFPDSGETTEWCILYNQTQKTLDFYHQERYDTAFSFSL